MLIDQNNFRWQQPKGFIVIEGLNGAGKSTLQRSLAELINKSGKVCLMTREPGASQIGQKIRELVLTSAEPISGLAELFLFSADRTEHIHNIIKPALSRREIILCDRYIYSTIAFQGAGRGLDLSLIEQINKVATTDLLPDLVIYLDLDAKLGLERTKARNSSDNQAEHDRFESEKLDFHNRLRESFLSMAKSRSEKFLVIDSSQPKEVVLGQAFKAVSAIMKSMNELCP